MAPQDLNTLHCHGSCGECREKAFPARPLLLLTLTLFPYLTFILWRAFHLLKSYSALMVKFKCSLLCLSHVLWSTYSVRRQNSSHTYRLPYTEKHLMMDCLKVFSHSFIPKMTTPAVCARPCSRHCRGYYVQRRTLPSKHSHSSGEERRL